MQTDKFKLIIEQRTIEAQRKNFMGPNGKLARIARYLGTPIMSHDDLPSNEQDEDWLAMPQSEDVSSRMIGWLFDGLKHGYHFEIHFIADLDEEDVAHLNTLSVYHKGHKVFGEEFGDLMGYAPNPEWETIVDKFSVLTTGAERHQREARNAKIRPQIERLNKLAIEEFRRKWGL